MISWDIISVEILNVEVLISTGPRGRWNSIPAAKCVSQKVRKSQLQLFTAKVWFHMYRVYVKKQTCNFTPSPRSSETYYRVAMVVILSHNVSVGRGIKNDEVWCPYWYGSVHFRNWPLPPYLLNTLIGTANELYLKNKKVWYPYRGGLVRILSWPHL